MIFSDKSYHDLKRKYLGTLLALNEFNWIPSSLQFLIKRIDAIEQEILKQTFKLRFEK